MFLWMISPILLFPCLTTSHQYCMWKPVWGYSPRQCQYWVSPCTIPTIPSLMKGQMWGRQGCVPSLPCNGEALCWPLEKSALAEGSAELAGTALCWAQPLAEQRQAPCLFLPSRQRSSCPLSLNSHQVSCSNQPHKQNLRQEKMSNPLWNPFFWWQWLEVPLCLSSVKEDISYRQAFVMQDP